MRCSSIKSIRKSAILPIPHYWDGEVPTKHLILSITPNVETRLAKLQTNECQIIPAPSPVQFPVIKGNKDLALHAGRGAERRLSGV